MSYADLSEKLRQLKTEEIVWIVYIGIIILSFYSNTLERKYFIYNDVSCKEKYRKTLIFIFSILVIIYLYFLESAYTEVKNIKVTDSLEKKNLVYLSFFASLLIAISGAIFLYIAISDEELNVEIAFN